MYLQISNKGLVEAGALSLMGASVKDGAAIGKFGSGFKYALATLCRHGLTPRIFSGETELKIETKPELFRENSFDVLWIDGVRTSITTQTGKEWKLRDAIREIWSNARDEGGNDWLVEPDITPVPGKTLIAIPFDRVNVLSDMVANWEMYFCEEVPALFECHNGRILEQPVTNFFRRGVWICEDRDHVGLFSYDFEDIDLPESRKIASASTTYATYSVLAQCTTSEVWEKIIANCEGNTAEANALVYWKMGSSCVGKKVAKEVFEKSFDCYGLAKYQDKIKTSGQKVKWVNEKGALFLSSLGVDNIADVVDFSISFEYATWPIGYRDKLDKPLAILSNVGIDVAQFPIKYIRFREASDKNPIALAHRGQCLLTDAAFEASPEMLMKALIEEWTHLQHNVLDHTVAQQHVYLNLIVSLIERIK